MKKKFYAIKIIKKVPKGSNDYYFDYDLKRNSYITKYGYSGPLCTDDTKFFSNKMDAKEEIQDLKLEDHAQVVKIIITVQNLGVVL